MSSISNDSTFVAEGPPAYYYPLKCQTQKIVEFANTVDLDEMAHIELSDLDLQCLSLRV